MNSNSDRTFGGKHTRYAVSREEKSSMNDDRLVGSNLKLRWAPCGAPITILNYRLFELWQPDLALHFEQLAI